MVESHGSFSFNEDPAQFRFYSLKTDKALPFFIFWPRSVVSTRLVVVVLALLTASAPEVVWITVAIVGVDMAAVEDRAEARM